MRGPFATSVVIAAAAAAALWAPASASSASGPYRVLNLNWMPRPPYAALVALMAPPAPLPEPSEYDKEYAKALEALLPLRVEADLSIRSSGTCADGGARQGAMQLLVLCPIFEDELQPAKPKRGKKQ
jgi:hypothetical protein